MGATTTTGQGSCLCPFNEIVYLQMEIDRHVEKRLEEKWQAAVFFGHGTDRIGIRHQIHLGHSNRILRDPSDFTRVVHQQLSLFRSELAAMMVDADTSADIAGDDDVKAFINEWDAQSRDDRSLGASVFQKWVKCFAKSEVTHALFKRITDPGISLTFLKYLIDSGFKPESIGVDRPSADDVGWYLSFMKVMEKCQSDSGPGRDRFTILEVPLHNPNKGLIQAFGTKRRDYWYESNDWRDIVHVFVVSLMGYRRRSLIDQSTNQLMSDINRVRELEKEVNYVVLSEFEAFTSSLRDWPMSRTNNQFPRDFDGRDPSDARECTQWIQQWFEEGSDSRYLFITEGIRGRNVWDQLLEDMYHQIVIAALMANGIM